MLAIVLSELHVLALCSLFSWSNVWWQVSGIYCVLLPPFCQHEKFTSQLQLGKKPTCAEPLKTPKSSPDKAKVNKPTEPIAVPAVKPAEANKGDDKIPGKNHLHDVRVYFMDNYISVWSF